MTGELKCKRCGGKLYAWAHECPADYCDPGAAVPFVPLDDEDRAGLAAIEALLAEDRSRCDGKQTSDGDVDALHELARTTVADERGPAAIGHVLLDLIVLRAQLADAHDAVMKLEHAEAKLAIARGALEWYADPKNNGKREFHEIDGVDVSRHRWIDEDEGEVAREALEKLKDM
jgi:hypothetical protein